MHCKLRHLLGTKSGDAMKRNSLPQSVIVVSLLMTVYSTAPVRAVLASPAKLHELVVNDDGIDEPGLAALVGALPTIATVTVAAPAQETRVERGT